MDRKNEIYTADDVCRDSVLKFFNDCKEQNIDIHTISVFKNNVQKIRIALPPYSGSYKAQLYSLSKSFCSTAIGFLIDDKVLSTEDRLIDIFPDKCTELDVNWSELRVRHLLSMNTGHEQCVLSKIKDSDDILKKFFEQKLTYKPGTHFAYNSAATYVLSEIVTKLTGKTLFDFLSERLFEPLEIKGTLWDSFNFCSQGGVGFHASIDDIAKLGLLYLNKGVWNGERLLSEEWIKEATSAQSDNSNNGTPDWTSGYGYQFWINSNGGFRGDGAFGQLCMVFPDDNVVIAVQAIVADMQAEIYNIYELKDNLIGKSKVSDSELSEKLSMMNCISVSQPFDEKYAQSYYYFDDNKLGITSIKFTAENEDVVLNFSDGNAYQKIACGFGKYRENSIMIKCLKPTLCDLCGTEAVQNVHFAAAYTYDTDVLSIHIRYLDNPHVETIECRFSEDSLDVIFHIEKWLVPNGADRITSVKRK